MIAYVNRLAPLSLPDGVTSVVWPSTWYWSRTPTVVINIIRELNLKFSSINPQYRLLVFTNTEILCKTNHNLTFRMGQKIQLQTIVQTFTKYWWILHILYISQGSVATQLRCGGMFGNHFCYKFFTECTSEKSLKIGQYLAKIWIKLCGLLFWATL